METKLVRDDRVPATDAALLQALQRLSVPSGTSGAMTFGVEDAEGQVYRIVRASGVCETVRIFETARELGFAIGSPRFSASANLQKVLRARA
jgi:hypothetical protein